MSARVPLWYFRFYDVGHVAAELLRCYPPQEAGERLMAYADWLRAQEAAPPASTR